MVQAACRIASFWCSEPAARARAAPPLLALRAGSTIPARPAMPIPSKRRLPSLRLLAIALVIGAVCLAGLDQTPAQARPQVRLAVLVVFDQLRADYLQRWQELFGPGGFRRLQEEGACFENCHYPYAHTFTGPGHASLLTGCCPDQHGIVDNDWYDQGRSAAVSCVA